MRKNPAAVALGKLGGKARAAALSPEERSRIAHQAGKLGGRPRSDAPRCACGAMTLERARARGHKCS